MVSTETKLTVARVIVVMTMVAAAVCMAAVNRLPIFRLRLADSDKWTITQSLWTTDIYTPVGEQHIPARRFTEKCPELAKAFRVAQIANVTTLVALGLAFVCGLLHLAPSFTSTNRHVRKVCGAPICMLLVVALVAVGLQGYVVKSMYEKDTWCSNSNDNSTMQLPQLYDSPTAAPESNVVENAELARLTLAEELEEAVLVGTIDIQAEEKEEAVSICVETEVVEQDAAANEGLENVDVLVDAALDAAPVVEIVLGYTEGEDPYQPFIFTPEAEVTATDADDEEEEMVGDDKKKCNPFEKCIASYEAMGFHHDRGYDIIWAALYVAIFALVVEMLVMAVGASDVPQAGVAQETVALLHGDGGDGRII